MLLIDWKFVLDVQEAENRLLLFISEIFYFKKTISDLYF